MSEHRSRLAIAIATTASLSCRHKHPMIITRFQVFMKGDAGKELIMGWLRRAATR
ncbi:hypothetical protein [Kibdelosporangium philippinense]|uniref:hypothetical protein n=1 Tax=Kibdelosporangium philippinense TaxID=211113 RepID=UPI003612AFB8